MSAKRTKAIPDSDEVLTPADQADIVDLGPEAIVDRDAPQAAAETSAAETPPPMAPPQHRRTTRWWLPVAAAALGAMAGAWLYRDWLISYFPPSQLDQQAARIAMIEQQASDGQRRIEALDAASAALQKSGDTFASSVAQATQASAATQQAVSAIETRLAAAEKNIAAAAAGITDLRASMDQQSATPNAGAQPDPAALSALAQRVTKLEADLAALSEASAPSTQSAAVTRAFAALRSEALAGRPYTEQLAAVTTALPAFDGLDVLEAHAAAGAPTPDMLARELDAMPPPAAPQNETYLDSVLGMFEGLITVRRIGAEDQKSLTSAVAAQAAKGDLAAALKTLDDQRAMLPPELETWRGRAAARIAVEQALARASDAVMRHLADGQ